MVAPSSEKTPSLEALLDELLPCASPEQIELHRNAALLEVDEPMRLLELVRDPAIRSLLLCRLAPTVVLVDCGNANQLVDLLRRRGHTPRVAGA